MHLIGSFQQVNENGSVEILFKLALIFVLGLLTPDPFQNLFRSYKRPGLTFEMSIAPEFRFILLINAMNVVIF